MLEIRGDIFELQADAIGITTNGIVRKNGNAIMGAGVAKAANDRYPGIDQRLGKYLRQYGNRVFILHRASTSPWEDEPRELFSFPTKEHWRHPSSLELIERSAKQLVDLADKRDWQQVILPQPGCGLGGLDWQQQVRPLLAEIWDQRFIISQGL